jgi:molybdopterin-guanine dinucleotide biosynthesis protein A
MSGRRRFIEVSGFVVAGGESRRMGLDKGGLPFGRERMIERQIRLLRATCRSVSMIGPPYRFADAGVQIYEDEIPGKGPLGGIYTGLRRARTEFSLFLSCDMPFMEARFLRYLCEQALASPASATVPPPCGKGHYPLCVVLRRRVALRVRSCLASGRNQVGRFLSLCRPRTLSKAEFARAGFSPRIFCNLNTREEYEKARKQFEALGEGG